MLRERRKKKKKDEKKREKKRNTILHFPNPFPRKKVTNI